MSGPAHFGDAGMSTWECVNAFGAVVYDGMFENEARLIAAQHGLRARENAYKARAMREARRLQWSKGPEFLRPDDWYQELAALLAERAPA